MYNDDFDNYDKYDEKESGYTTETEYNISYKVVLGVTYTEKNLCKRFKDSIKELFTEESAYELCKILNKYVKGVYFDFDIDKPNSFRESEDDLEFFIEASDTVIDDKKKGYLGKNPDQKLEEVIGEIYKEFNAYLDKYAFIFKDEDEYEDGEEDRIILRPYFDYTVSAPGWDGIEIEGEVW